MKPWKDFGAYHILQTVSAQQLFGTQGWEEKLAYLKKKWGEVPNFDPAKHLFLPDGDPIWDLQATLWSRLIPAYMRWHMLPLPYPNIQLLALDTIGALLEKSEPWKEDENEPFRLWWRSGSLRKKIEEECHYLESLSKSQ